MLADTVSATVTGPHPLTGDTVSQLAFDDVVQGQPGPVPSDTDVVMGAAPRLTDDCDTVKLQPPPGDSVNAFDAPLTDVPWGPTAATRDS